VDSGGPKEAQVQSCLPGGTNVLSLEARWRHLANTIVPSVCGGDAALCQTTLTIFIVALRSRHYIFALWFLSIWSPYGIGQTIIFSCCGLFFFFFFFVPRLISAAADWMTAILPHMVWPQCRFKMQVRNLLHAARSLKTQDAKKSPKIAIWAPSHNFVGLYLRN